MAKRSAPRRAARSTVAPATRRPAFRKTEDAPQQQQQQRRPPFLKAEDIGNRAMLKFVPGTCRTTQAPWGHQLIVDVQVRGGGTYSWGIGTNKPNLRLLVEHLISNPGKPLEIVKMRGDRGSFIAIPQETERPQIDDDADEVIDDDIPF